MESPPVCRLEVLGFQAGGGFKVGVEVVGVAGGESARAAVRGCLPLLGMQRAAHAGLASGHYAWPLPTPGRCSPPGACGERLFPGIWLQPWSGAGHKIAAGTRTH